MKDERRRYREALTASVLWRFDRARNGQRSKFAFSLSPPLKSGRGYRVQDASRS
jgi:hypothetical protein